MVELRVDHRGAGRRADVWLADRLNGISRSAVVRLFRAGRVEGLDRPLKPSTILKQGEGVHLRRTGMMPSEPPPPLPPILYEDDRLIAFHKPAGLLVHPAGPRFVWALMALVRRARPDLTPHLAHRLDRETSGVLLLAKDAEANRHLKRMFRLQLAQKVYWAVCRGHPRWSTILTDAPIGDDPQSPIRIKQGVTPVGQPARTRFFLKARFKGFSLVACHPQTGRTHQLRVHLHHLGHPILGDRIYGQPARVFLHLLEHPPDRQHLRQLGFPRQALHNRALRIPHPDGQPLEIIAPLPPDLRALLAAGVLPYAGEHP